MCNKNCNFSFSSCVVKGAAKKKELYMCICYMPCDVEGTLNSLLMKFRSKMLDVQRDYY